MLNNLPAKAGDLCSIPGLGSSPGEGNSYPHQLKRRLAHVLHPGKQTWAEQVAMTASVFYLVFQHPS